MKGNILFSVLKTFHRACWKIYTTVLFMSVFSHDFIKHYVFVAQYIQLRSTLNIKCEWLLT